MELYVQPGFQTKVFRCKAEIAIIGGAMGSGKSYSIILETLKHIEDPNFRCVIFRKHRGNIKTQGGLWDEMSSIVGRMKNVRLNRSELAIRFPSGASVCFEHINRSNAKQFLKGTQYSAVFIDEGDEFSEDIFQFLFSRMRSQAKIAPYMRITTNPTEGWLKKMVQPFLNDDEYPNEKICGKVKYIYFLDNNPVVRDNKEDFIKEGLLPISEMEYIKTFTFIAGNVNDNVKLLDNNPGYISNLNSLASYEKDRYINGWWGALPKDGLFKQEDFKIFAGWPKETDRHIITVDTALKASSHNDYSVATCWAFKKNHLYLVDMLRGRWTFQEMNKRMEEFIMSHEKYVDSVYIEDIQTGSVLLSSLRFSMRETQSIRFVSLYRGVRESKSKRAQGALSNMNHITVHLPYDAPAIRRVFLKEVCSFSLDDSHKNDDISDTFFDAINILGRKMRKQKAELGGLKVVQLYNKFEMMGSFSGA